MVLVFNGQYPDTKDSCSTYDECSSAQSIWNTPTNPLYALVTQGFISKLPVDPTNTPTNNVVYNNGTDYAYYYSSTSGGGAGSDYTQSYDLLARLENLGNPSSCGVKGISYCNSAVIWPGWNWETSSAAGDFIVYYHP